MVMRVLLTGGSGFIGRHVLAGLQARGIDVITLGRTPASRGADHIQFDLLTDDGLAPILREVQASHLLHLAWETTPGEYWTSSSNIRWTEASMRLVEAFCTSGGEQVIFAGTCAEYDWDYGYCREDHTPLAPRKLYGASKVATRQFAMALCDQFGVLFSCGRIFFPFGLGESSTRLIPSLVDALSGRRALFAVQADAYRDFMHVHDVAEGFIQLLRSGVGGTYNICSGEPTKLSDLVIRVAELLRVDPAPILNKSPDPQSNPVLVVGDNRKLRSLGWHPSLDASQGLRKALAEMTGNSDKQMS